MDPRSTIRAVLDGDRDRFVEIVRAFDPPMRRIVARRITDPGALDEVIQEFWWRAYRQLSHLTDVLRLEPWLGRIARNCVADHFRAARRTNGHEPLSEEAACHNPDDPVPSSVRVWALVDRLDPAHREVLAWRYREQVAYAEMARRAGVPVSTIRGRLHTARTALRRLLAQCENQDPDPDPDQDPDKDQDHDEPSM